MAVTLPMNVHTHARTHTHRHTLTHIHTHKHTHARNHLDFLGVIACYATMLGQHARLAC